MNWRIINYQLSIINYQLSIINYQCKIIKGMKVSWLIEVNYELEISLFGSRI